MRQTMRLAAAALILLVGSGASWAKGMTLDQLQALTTGLGYEPTVDDGDIVIPDQGRTHQKVFLRLVDDGAKVGILSSVYFAAGDKKAAIPYEGLLRANNDAPFAFGMSSDDKHSWVFLDGFSTARP